jgi:anhydro-N-acetylmuramic acid kinase
LLDDWAADGTVAAALAGEWRPPTPASAALIDALVRCASERGIAATDAVRTLIRLVACGIADLIAAANPRPAEAVLAAGGRVGRWLQRDLSELLPEARFLAASDIGFPPRVLDAAATAWWGQLYLDQTPANLPTLTGARAPRVLGRFTPGAPQQFLRLTRLMAASQPVVSLRTAI